jgi:hypothetical protein
VNRTLRLLLLAGLSIGIIAGVVVALAVPKTKDRPGARATATAAAAKAKAPPADPVRVAAPLAQLPGFEVGLRVDRASVRLEARTPDPRGGPDWAVRVFRAARLTEKSSRRPGVDPVVGRNLCAQLGRVHRGRFGWIDASATFRPAGFSQRGAPLVCGSRRPDMGRRPQTTFEALMTDPAAGEPRVYRTVLWGLAGAAARSATTTLGGRRATTKLSARGAFVVLAPGTLHADQAKIRLRYAAGPSKLVDLGLAGAPPNIGPRGLKGRPVGQTVVEARAADPSGGLPWGVSATRSSGGGWCVTPPGRVVGDRLGQPDTALDTVREGFPSGYDCPGNRGTLTRARPLSLASQYGGAVSPRDSSRTVRRTLPGRTIFSGVTRGDVASVTIATPRDVRTLVPTRRAHAFVAVYDGTFPTGEVVITSTFEDGTTHVMKLPPAI